MFIIWGMRTALRLLGIVTVTCRGCTNPAAHRIEEHRRVLSLFFVPLFTIGRKTLITCTYCGLTGEVPPDQLPGLLAQAFDVPGGRLGGANRPETLPDGPHPEHP